MQMLQLWDIIWPLSERQLFTHKQEMLEGLRRRENTHSLLGLPTSAATVEVSVENSPKAKRKATTWPTSTILWHTPEGLMASYFTDTGSAMVVAIPVIISRTGKVPKCPMNE